jgi:hypothetical protein
VHTQNLVESPVRRKYMGERKTWPMTRLALLAAGIVSAILSVALIVVAVRLSPHLLAAEFEGDPAVGLATAGLALFTGLLFLAAAITAFFAYEEISTSTAVNSADLALQLDNRFNSDRGLRIRHGAVTFLANQRGVPLHCYHNISPYCTGQYVWYGLTSDLVDIFNYLDWIGYLVDERTKAVEREVVAQKFGPWFINYYQICADEIAQVREKDPARWQYLAHLYDKLIQREKDLYAKLGKPYRAERESKEIDNFLQLEHIRSHRGFNATSDVDEANLPGSEAHPLQTPPVTEHSKGDSH